MKRIKTSELKTHLSHYLREVSETGEGIEICVREQPVAYMTPAKTVRPESAGDAETERELAVMTERMQAVGLRLDEDSWRRNWHGRPAFEPVGPLPVAGDGRTDVNSVVAMRTGQDW